MTNRTDKQVVIGTIGAGFAAGLHGNGYRRVYQVPVRLKTIADLNLAFAEKIREEFGYEKVTEDYREILQDPEIDIVDIVTPPFLHKNMILEALAAGKHVICEKPLTGCFGAKDGSGKETAAAMYKQVCEDLQAIRDASDKAGKKVMYAENYIYATPLQKAAELVRAKKCKLLFMKGEESTPGSMSAGAGRWSSFGGGPLFRIGCHPIGGMLYLKQVEAKARGEKIHAVSVLADTGVSTKSLKDEEKNYIKARPEDVEDFGTVTVTFSDGTKCMMIATDILLGGTKNYIELYGHDTAMVCNLTPTDMLSTYFSDEKGIEDVILAEMLPSKRGWNKAFVSDEVIRGYMDELGDFCEAAAFDRDPVCTLDLAVEVTKIIYAAYQSAEEERRIYL